MPGDFHPDRRSAPLKAVHFHILLALLDGPRHGYGLVREIEETTEGRIRLEPGNLYRYVGQLHRMELIEESPEPPGEEGTDDRRRYYRITAAGKDALLSDMARMKSLLRRAEARLEGDAGLDTAAQA